MTGPRFLDLAVQHYDWGERGPRAFIPGLLGIKPKRNFPYAELWIGAHASLPFFMKVISAEKGLSIQAHPNARQARSGFSRELKLQDPEQKNYPDPNPKFEMTIALSDFYLLSGFRPLPEILELWRGVPELNFLARQAPPSLKNLFRFLMTMEQSRVNEILSSLTKRLTREEDRFAANRLESWLLKADRERCSKTFKDRGLFSFFLLNFIHLKPGEAHVIEPGRLHCHLMGVGIEVMTNSDNVVRGGLTSKRVDVPELMKISAFKSNAPDVVRSSPDGIFGGPAKAFQVRKILGRKEVALPARRDHILFMLDGESHIETSGDAVSLKKGQAVFLRAQARPVKILPHSSNSQAYVCSGA